MDSFLHELYKHLNSFVVQIKVAFDSTNRLQFDSYLSCSDSEQLDLCRIKSEKNGINFFVGSSNFRTIKQKQVKCLLEKLTPWPFSTGVSFVSTDLDFLMLKKLRLRDDVLLGFSIDSKAFAIVRTDGGVPLNSHYFKNL